MSFTGWQWLAVVVGALLIGISKTGITGLSLLFVVIFASVMPARASTGLVLPLLVVGDIIAVLSYRRHAQWRHVWRLLPWAAGGVVGGAVLMGRMSEKQTRDAIGAIVVGLAVLHLVRRARNREESAEKLFWFAPLVGVLAGFATIISNSSGPLMVIYLLAMRLPKMEYMGTGSVYFLILNVFKAPFMASMGLVTAQGLALDLKLAPVVIAGSFFGRWLLGKINQRLFENILLALTLVAGAKMLISR